MARKILGLRLTLAIMMIALLFGFGLSSAATAPMPLDGTLNPPGFRAVKFFPNLWVGDRSQKNDPLSYVFNTELYIFSRGFFDDHRDGIQWDLQIPFGFVKGRGTRGERTQSTGFGDVFAFAEYYYTLFRQGQERYVFGNLLLGVNFPTGEYDPEDNGTIGHHIWQGTELIQLGGRWDKLFATLNLIGYAQSERHRESSRLERETLGTGSKLPDRVFTAFNMTYWPSPKWGAGLAGGFEKSVHSVERNGGASLPIGFVGSHVLHQLRQEPPVGHERFDRCGYQRGCLGCGLLQLPPDVLLGKQVFDGGTDEVLCRSLNAWGITEALYPHEGHSPCLSARQFGPCRDLVGQRDAGIFKRGSVAILLAAQVEERLKPPKPDGGVGLA